VVIVEGVFSTRPELRPLLGVTVYVDTSPEVRVARMRARRYEDLNWLESWMAAEDWYVEHIRPAEHVDIVLDGSGPSS
jgi:uridine kinase